MDANSEPIKLDRGELFSRLLIANRRRIYAFILTLVHDPVVAEDVFQEVSSVLWKKFDKFTPDPDSDFAIWAMSVARFSVLEFRRKQQRQPLNLSEAALESLADQAVAASCEFELRREALGCCLENFKEEDRSLLLAKFSEGKTVVSLAAAANRSRVSIHNRLTKLMNKLMDCIRTRLASDGFGDGLSGELS